MPAFNHLESRISGRNITNEACINSEVYFGFFCFITTLLSNKIKIRVNRQKYKSKRIFREYTYLNLKQIKFIIGK